MEIPRMGLPDDLTARLTIAEQHDLLSRRPMSRRIGRRGVLAGAAGAAAMLAIGGPAAATLWRRPDMLPGHLVVPFGRHLAWGANPRSQVRVGWQVPLPVRNPFIRIGESAATLGDRLPAEIRDLHSQLPAGRAIDQYYVHAALENLHAGRRYYYSVGHDGYGSPPERVESFTTAPTRRQVARPFTFTAFGDQGVSLPAMANDGLVAAQQPAFHLHAGDLCYADPIGHGHGSDRYQPRAWDLFLAQTEPVAASVPWMATLGNHDMEALYSPDGYGGQRARWDFPDNGPAQATGAYSFVYGNVGVVALDSNDVSYEIPANFGYTGGTQTTWLDQRLQHLRGLPDVDFVVVFHHHCAYSTAVNHASEGGIRSQWVPLFDKYQVDLVINGHNHVYERADAMRGGTVRQAPIGSTVHPATDGTTYVTAGAGGRGLYRFAAPDSYLGHVHDVDQVRSHVAGPARHDKVEKVGWSRVRFTGYSFLAVDVKPAAAGGTATMTLRALADTGTQIDHLVIARQSGGAGRSSLDDGAA